MHFFCDVYLAVYMHLTFTMYEKKRTFLEKRKEKVIVRNYPTPLYVNDKGNSKA